MTAVIDAVERLLGALLAAGVLGLIVRHMLRRERATGAPTPEESRIHVEHQERRDAVDAATGAAVAAAPVESDAELEREMNR